jgi:hypothetical protein
MKLIKTTITAALLGLSGTAFAAVNDISHITHHSISSQQTQVGGSQPSWSDLSAVTQKGTSRQATPFAKSTSKYSFSDISSVTHN